jgi:hypothetical protein
MIPTFDKVVIDSGPLFTVLALNYVVRTNRRSLLQTIEEDIGRSVSMQNACLKLFRSIQSILTTSHVIGEMQGLQTSRLKLRGADLNACAKAACCSQMIRGLSHL